MAGLNANYREQAELLGPRRHLLALVTRPAGRAAEQAPVVVFLNTGIIHHVGHHRMYVTLARRLAARGLTCVRFDFSGLGDSLPRGDGKPPLQAWTQDIRLVLDWMQGRYGSSRFVLTGLCAGADHAVLYGRNDPRVTGLVLMDPSLPPTRRYYFHYVLQRLGDPRSWWSLATGRSGLLKVLLRHLRQKLAPRGQEESMTLDNLVFNPVLRHSYRDAAARNCRFLAVFTTVSRRHTYHEQILDAFPETASGGMLRLEYFADSDHLFSQPGNRERLYQVLVDWLRLA